MKTYPIRRVPWTCEWGRFGVATEDLGSAGTRVDDVFWRPVINRLDQLTSD